MEGGTKSKWLLMGLDDIDHNKGCMANSMLWRCGLGYQLLGLCHYACLGNNLIRDHLLQVRPRPAQHLFNAA